MRAMFPPAAPSPLGIVGWAVCIFATTNVDDLILLTAFFANPTMRDRAVVFGQFAGMVTLTAVSVVAALLAVEVPAGWLSLIGIAPLALGIRSFAGLWHPRAEP